MRIRTLLLAGGMLVAGVLAPMSALATTVLHLQLSVGGACPYGTRPNTDPIRVKLLRSDGTPRETKHDDSVSTHWSVCFTHVPVPGDRIQMINGTGEDRTVTVPELTLSVDRVTSVVGGHGPRNKTVAIQYEACQPLACLPPVTRHTTVDGHGRYRKDLSANSIDIDGAGAVRVEYLDSAGDSFDRSTEVQYIQIRGPSEVYVGCAPRGTTTLRLLTDTGRLRATRSFTVAEACTGRVEAFHKNGQPVNIHVGDRVTSTMSSESRITWPAMSVTHGGGVLSGRCFPNALYGVFIYHNGFYTDWSGVTDSTGRFSGVPPILSLDPGDTLDLICQTHAGDRGRLIRTV